MNQVAKWTTSPGFCNAEKLELINAGVVVYTWYDIVGTGAPGSDYDLAPLNSTYKNLSTGRSYERLVKEDLITLIWAPRAVCVPDTAFATLYTNQDIGLIAYNGADDTALKIGAIGADTAAALN
jgi:hypothetical protein